MATLLHNISGELTQELLAAGDNARVSSISLTNARAFLSGVTGASSTCKVDLYIEKESNKFYILKDISLPLGATLSHDFTMNNSIGEYGLYIKLTRGDTFTLTGSIDVTGTNTTVPGSGTAFTTEFSIGDEILVTGETRTISKIESDTVAAVSAAWGSDLANDATPDCNPEAKVDVIIS
jgi:hypothetical protein